jgi:predicted amidohydrolase
MKVLKAAAVQISPVLYSREGTVEKVVRTIHELGQQGVGFATFPETVSRTTRTFRTSKPLTRSLADVSTSSCSARAGRS